MLIRLNFLNPRIKLDIFLFVLEKNDSYDVYYYPSVVALKLKTRNVFEKALKDDLSKY